MKSFIKKAIGKRGANQLRSLQIDLKGMYYGLGNGVECPICEHTYRRFLPFRHRQQALCPHCRSLERHRLIFLYLKNRTDFFTTQKKILHFAPEKCFYKKFKEHPGFEYVTADYMVSFMDNIGVMPDHVMSIDDIKFPDNSFDVIIAIGILLLVPDDQKALAEIYRTLKPGGYAVLEDPINYQSPVTEEYDLSTPEKKAVSLQKYGHLQYRLYGSDYKERIEREGFRMVEEPYGKEVDAQKYGVNPWGITHLAYKPR